MEKSGVSTIVATVLIILITVASVTILWVGVAPLLAIDVSGFDTRLLIVTASGYTFFDPENRGGTVTLQVEAKGEKAADYVQIILTLEDGEELISVYNAPGLNAVFRYYLGGSAYNFDPNNLPTHVAVAPIFVVNGRNVLGFRGKSVKLAVREEGSSFYEGSGEPTDPTGVDVEDDDGELDPFVSGGDDEEPVSISFSVKNSYKINESRFGNGNELDGDLFGSALANLGDLDGDGIVDLAVGEFSNDDGGDNNGAFWIMFMNANGSVKDSYKINESRFGNGNELNGNRFGVSLANLGDLDGDNIVDLAVGEYLDGDGDDLNNGAFWIMFMNANGSVKDSYKINESRFGNGDELDGDHFGFSLANLGDLDGDNIVDLAVGERLSDDGNGAFWIMFMNKNGSVKDSYKINESRFGNGDELNSNRFGVSLAGLGDLDGDGIVDLAVGEHLNDDGGNDNGAVWILFMNSNGSVKYSYKINESRFGNGNELNGDFFGFSLASLGDLDVDGFVDLAVGEYFNDDGGTNDGAFWTLNFQY